MKFFIKRSFAFLTVILLFLSTTQGIHAQDSTDKTARSNYKPRVVKVAISDSNYFSKKQENGTYAGVTIDYLSEISKYAGWDLEYVECSVNEITDKIANGEADLAGSLLKNEYTLLSFDVADYSSGFSYTTLTVLQDNDQYRSMDYSSFSGMRIGIYSKAVNRIPAFETFIESNGILNVTPVFYDDHVAFNDALEKGEVDAILSNDTSLEKEQKIIAKFEAVPYYFGVQKNNTELLRELNMALATLTKVNPNFDNMVYDKYFKNVGEELVLSKNEDAFIQTAAPLKVAMMTNLAPIEYYDKATKKMAGISVDILSLLSEKTGLEFEYIPVNTLEKAKKMLLAGEVDLITSFCDKPLEKENIVYTKQYLDNSIITVENLTKAQGDTNIVATPRGYHCTAVVTNKDTVIYYDSVEACIQAVIAGEAHSTSFNSLVIDHYTYLRGNHRISLTPMSNVSSGIRIGLAQPANPALLIILDKAIYNLSSEQIQFIVYENTTKNNAELPLTYLIYDNPVRFVLIVIGIFIVLLVAVILVMLYMRTRLKLAQQTVLQTESYRIIGELTDEYIYDFDFEKAVIFLPKSFSLLTGYPQRWSISEINKKENNVMKTLFSVFAEEIVSGESAEFECELPNGNRTWFKAVGTVLYDSEKKPVKGIGKISSIQIEKQEKLVLESKANTDSLTGLYNKYYCEKEIINYFEQDKEEKSGALLLMDLDYFKRVNDTLGHMAGDMVLRDFAKRLTSVFRKEDIIGRWGGDEFIVFISNVREKQEVAKRAQELCQMMNKEFSFEGKTHMLSISVGIAMASDATSYNQLFQRVDNALYEVKRDSRNGYKLY